MNIAAFSPAYATGAPPASVVSTVRNSSEGLVMETIGKLKISEIDGKNVTSMFGSGPGEGEVLSRVSFGSGKAAVLPDLYTGEDTQLVPSASAAVSAYQAVSGFGSTAAAPTVSLDS